MSQSEYQNIHPLLAIYAEYAFFSKNCWKDRMLRLSENYYQKYFALLLVIEQENNDSAEITKR